MSTRIRILQIIRDFYFEGSGGGIGRFGVGLSRTLDANLFDISICAMWNLGSEEESMRIEKLNETGIRAFSAAEWRKNSPYRSFMFSLRNIHQWLGKHPIDIIHSHSEFSDIVGICIKLLYPKLIIMRTIHNGYKLEWRKRPLRRFFLSYILNPLIFDYEIGVSKDIKSNLDRRMGAVLLRKHSYYIPNGIELNRFQQKQRQLKFNNHEHTHYYVGSAGRLAPEKGYKYLILAAVQVLKQIPDISFTVVGIGEDEKYLRCLVNELKIQDRFIFPGPTSEIEEFLLSLDIFISSSLWEGLSTSILESMAAGTPIIATRIPGNQELIQHLENGWLFSPTNSNELANQIVNAVQRPDLRALFASRSKEIVKLYSIDSVAKKYESLYLSSFRKKGSIPELVQE